MCHRYPPIVTPGGFVFPIVDSSEWCGEWRVALTKAPEEQA
jgi:hypothetical protein